MVIKAIVSQGKRVIWWLATMFLGRLIFGRIVIFSIAYFNAYAEYKENADINDHCQVNSDFALRVPKTCEVAKTAVAHGPLLTACSKLREQTYSCIDFSCGDFFMTILDSWAMIVISCFIVFTVFFVGTSRFYNKMQVLSYDIKRKTLEKRRQEYEDFQRNNVLLNLPADDTTHISLDNGHVGYLSPRECVYRINHSDQ